MNALLCMLVAAESAGSLHQLGGPDFENYREDVHEKMQDLMAVTKQRLHKMHAAFRAAGAAAAPRRARHSSLLEEVARARAGATAREFAEERNQEKLHASAKRYL